MNVANIIALHGLEHGVKRCTFKANPALCATVILNWILAHPNQRVRIMADCVSCLRQVLPEHVGIGAILVKSDEAGDYVVFIPNPPIKK